MSVTHDLYFMQFPSLKTPKLHDTKLPSSNTTNIINITMQMIPVNYQIDAQIFSYMFISILYMFRAALCPSSGELLYQCDTWFMSLCVGQCFSTAGPRPGTGPWHQLYRAARGSPAICHFSFLSNFQE